VDSWYLGILMFHMVTGYLPAAFPSTQRLADQLVAAPNEFVQMAVALAHEKSFERPNITDALMDFSKVQQAVMARHIIESAQKPTESAVKSIEKNDKQLEDQVQQTTEDVQKNIRNPVRSNSSKELVAKK
ncbi:hypothetical protein BIW11_10389, partial [Tropilaelaps mercedesae]